MDVDDVRDHVASAREILGKLGFAFVVFCVLALVGLGIFRVVFVDFVDNYEIGYRYDTFGANAGKIQVLPRTGYFVTWPFKTKIHEIDGRPMQVCISAIKRVLNCKLVQFNPAGIELFLQWHGRDDYSNSSSTADQPSQFNQILMNYAYDGSGRSYPFLTVLRELKGDEASPPKLAETPTEAPK